jgi:hypothetical protein
LQAHPHEMRENVVGEVFFDKHKLRRISEYQHLASILPLPLNFTAPEFVECQE